MTDLVSVLLSFPPQPPAPEITSEIEYDRKAHVLLSSLRRIPTKDLLGNITSRQSLLDTLDPEKQSLSYLFVLLAHHQGWETSVDQHLSGHTRPGGAVWCKSVNFLCVFDPVQVRYAGHEFNKLVDCVAKISEYASQQKPLAAVKPVRQALLRLDPSCSTFTSIHTTFAHLCLLAQCYLPATGILDKDICHFPTAADKTFLKRFQLLPCQQHPSSVSYITMASGLPGLINYKSSLEYFLYGAMIYIGLKRWGKARHFLEIAISAPTGNCISMAMVEAHKKWILVNLLEKGTVPAIPHAVSRSAAKAYKPLVKPYSALGIIFKAGSLSRLEAEIYAGMDIWQKDKNTGLVFQLLNALRRCSVLKLDQTFAALTLPDVLRFSMSDQFDRVVEPFVVELLAARRLDARLFQASNSVDPTILRFGHSFATMGGAMETRLWDRLKAQKQRMDILLGNVYGTDVKLELGREYIEGLRKAKWRKNESDLGDNSATVDFEEDMMADLR
ncbi:predicted protein [Uncinocarpus reesii 1704]|uniref:COP9 signalosome complex subunit 3 N-terminal helical repeats domain-containing protein n=1 Tax=Uncinocarpus reesii (strain UAMH 1704) TaxID=336963 RepID=C4JT81_UNCRE|nr:uncharacterized protein UREG_05670 [Uncinocarpus reesii 1704]EEP80828.1 predicted protein [Uncinocarpus reesii 1704]